jgi:hypothetical protein
MQYGVDTNLGMPGMRTIRNFACENPSTFSPSNPTIRIPIKSGNFLDLKQSRLAFDLTMGGTSTRTWLDGGAQCVISRVRILTPSNMEIERIEAYNEIAVIMDQYNLTEEEMRQKAMLDGSPWRLDPFLGYDPKLNDSIATGDMRHYEVPLSWVGWFNPTLERLLPPDIGFTVEITLSAANNCLVSNGVGTVDYTMANIYLKIPTVYVNSPGFMQRVATLKSSGTHWTASTFKLYTATWTQGAAEQTITISDRSHSLNALLVSTRKTAYVTSNTRFALSTRTIQYTDQYQATIGSDLYPVQQVEYVTDVRAGGTPEIALTFTSLESGIDVLNTAAIAQNAGQTGGTITLDAGGGADPPDCRIYFPPGTRFVTGAAFAGAAAGVIWTVTSVDTALIFDAIAESGTIVTTAAAVVNIQIISEKTSILETRRSVLTSLGTNISAPLSHIKQVFGMRKGLVDAGSYYQSEENAGCGILAIDTKVYRSNDRRTISGQDTASFATPITLKVRKTAAANADMQVNVYAMADITFVLYPNGDITPML